MSRVEFFTINNVTSEIDELRGGRWSVGVLWCPHGRTWAAEARFKREEQRLAVVLSLDVNLTRPFDETQIRSLAEAVGASGRDRQESANVLGSRLAEYGQLLIIPNQVGSSGYDLELAAELPVTHWILKKPPVPVLLFGFSSGFLQRSKHRGHRRLPRWHEQRLAADRELRSSE